MISYVGRFTLALIIELGRFSVFVGQSLWSVHELRFFPSKLIRAIFEMGVRCVPLILAVGGFTGLVVGLQGYRTLSQFGSQSTLGLTVALSLLNGLGPVISALMIVGQAGSALAAELGIQRNSEQIDALETMGISSLGFLVGPRLIAALVVFPLQTAFFNLVGMFGGYVSGVILLSQEPGIYWESVRSGIHSSNVYHGLLKAAVFGFAVTAICSFEGFNTHLRSTEKGVRGVSQSTTRAVVYSCIAVLAIDFLLTSVQG